MTSNRVRSRFIPAVLIGGALVFGWGWDATASASPIAGDDNGDGMVMEDESGWDCRTMGNLVCGTDRYDPSVTWTYTYTVGDHTVDIDWTYCPRDGVWSATWHWCGDGPDPGPNAFDQGAYVGGYN